MSATRARFALPHLLTLPTGCTILAAALSRIAPAGQYERRDDPATGKRVVIAGIIDTIVHGLVSPLEHLPLALGAVAMMIAQAVIHVPVPGVSGQAVLTMPVMVPVSDVIGLSRQVTVLAYLLLLVVAALAIAAAIAVHL